MEDRSEPRHPLFPQESNLSRSLYLSFSPDRKGMCPIPVEGPPSPDLRRAGVALPGGDRNPRPPIKLKNPYHSTGGSRGTEARDSDLCSLCCLLLNESVPSVLFKPSVANALIREIRVIRGQKVRGSRVFVAAGFSVTRVTLCRFSCSLALGRDRGRASPSCRAGSQGEPSLRQASHMPPRSARAGRSASPQVNVRIFGTDFPRRAAP